MRSPEDDTRTAWRLEAYTTSNDALVFLGMDRGRVELERRKPSLEQRAQSGYPLTDESTATLKLQLDERPRRVRPWFEPGESRPAHSTDESLTTTLEAHLIIGIEVQRLKSLGRHSGTLALPRISTRGPLTSGVRGSPTLAREEAELAEEVHLVEEQML